MSTSVHTRPDLEFLLARLEEARTRTLEIVAPVSDADLRTQHDVLMSPILWDLGHIAHFEALWLTRNLDGEIRFGEMPGDYNPFDHPRHVRGELVYPSRAESLALMRDIRERVVRRVESLDLSDPNPLIHDGYVLRMVLQHEYQHGETMLQTLQLKRGERYQAPRRYPVPEPVIDVPSGAMVRFPGGRVAIGTNDRGSAYDNERPRHEVDVAPFHIDVAPVRNGEFLAFIDDGGYRRREHWSDDGWRWLTTSGATAPKEWTREGSGWTERMFDLVRPLDPRRPVCHVCFHEAAAYATWAGKRLPTEVEWEVAAAWDPATGEARPFPWGDEPATPALANVDQLTFDTAPVGAYPRNVSPSGCYGLIGDVWEWTASDFAAWPGFEPFPYAEYSAVFFGSDYKVLRGGSFATRPGAIRNSFRNWDYPIRRQIFSGFRCARDD